MAHDGRRGKVTRGVGSGAANARAVETERLFEGREVLDRDRQRGRHDALPVRVDILDNGARPRVELRVPDLAVHAPEVDQGVPSRWVVRGEPGRGELVGWARRLPPLVGREVFEVCLVLLVSLLYRCCGFGDRGLAGGFGG